MHDPVPTAATAGQLAVSGQGLVDLHVFHSAVHKTRMAMALADPNLPDCPLVYVNPSFCEMTGYSGEEAIGRNCRFLQGPDTDPETVSRIRAAVAAGEVFEGEIYNHRKDGSGFWNSLLVSPVFDDAGKLAYFFASQFDVSQRKEAERRQAQRLESMGALASGVAHEFNNLMTVVLGSIERALVKATDEGQAKPLGRAEWAARRAGQLASELMSLARRQSSHDDVVEMNQVVRTFADTLAQVAGEATRVRFDLSPERLPVRLDAGQLELVLLNFVRNAADALSEGGDGVVRGSGEIVVSTRVLSAAEAAEALNGKAAVELSVADTGAGMSPEVLARATELFFTTKKTGKGTGVGLFLALEFADQSGGRLTFDSEPGRGTTARLVFPLAPKG